MKISLCKPPFFHYSMECEEIEEWTLKCVCCEVLYVDERLLTAVPCALMIW